LIYNCIISAVLSCEVSIMYRFNPKHVATEKNMLYVTEDLFTFTVKLCYIQSSLKKRNITTTYEHCNHMYINLPSRDIPHAYIIHGKKQLCDLMLYCQPRNVNTSLQHCICWCYIQNLCIISWFTNFRLWNVCSIFMSAFQTVSYT
jgi:hypothetical protein